MIMKVCKKNWFIDFSRNNHRRPVTGQSYSDWVSINLNFTCYFSFLEPEVDVQIVSVTSPTSQSILVKWQVNIRFILTNLFPCFSKDYHPVAIEVCGSFPRPPPSSPPTPQSSLTPKLVNGDSVRVRFPHCRQKNLCNPCIFCVNTAIVVHSICSWLCVSKGKKVKAWDNCLHQSHKRIIFRS